MQGSIVAIQLLELTSISGLHESLSCFSMLNEFTGPAGQSNEVVDDTYTTHEGLVFSFFQKWRKKKRKIYLLPLLL